MELRLKGLNWKRTHVADLENGRRETLDVGSLALLAFVFGEPVSRLLDGGGEVLLTPKSDWPTHGCKTTVENLRAALSGANDWMIWPVGEETTPAILKRLAHDLRNAPIAIERDLAKELGVDPSFVRDAADGLWGVTFAEERDRRVKELGDLPIGERQARQGHITRELKAALTKWVLEGEEPGADG